MFREYRCAARVAWWLCHSAVLARWYSLPALCRKASSHRSLPASRIQPARVIAVVQGVCGLPLFSLPFFPRACMRRSLALYRELTRMGHPATIHFGVRRENAALVGHSWVTLNGVPVGERDPLPTLSVTYSHSPWSSGSLRDRLGAAYSEG
jgi:hypothetical protein